MASRKLLKKQINEVCGELFADCVALKMCDQCSDEVINQAMAEILQLRLEFVARISHTEKGSVRLFYKKLRQEFSEKAEAISRTIIEAYTRPLFFPLSCGRNSVNSSSIPSAAGALK